MDFDFDFDFNLETYNKIDICGLVEKSKSKEKILWNLDETVSQLSALIGKPPSNNECFKMVSTKGGFSSLSIIDYIANLEKIDELYASTFRIGKKHFQALLDLKENKKLNKANFITSEAQEGVDSIMEHNGKKYDYYSYILQTCKDNDWNIKAFNNHSKLILMKTSKGNYYVVETSSNLNENPKMEHFSWENDRMLYEWYEKIFIEMLK